jgi:hypothetical protein
MAITLRRAQLHNLMVDSIQGFLVFNRPGKLLVMRYLPFVLDTFLAHGNSLAGCYPHGYDCKSSKLFRWNTKKV